MPFTDAPVLPKPAGPGTGISMSMRELKLPGWCRPSGTGGKMEAEFGLKRAPGK